MPWERGFTNMWILIKSLICSHDVVATTTSRYFIRFKNPFNCPVALGIFVLLNIPFECTRDFILIRERNEISLIQILLVSDKNVRMIYVHAVCYLELFVRWASERD